MPKAERVPSRRVFRPAVGCTNYACKEIALSVAFAASRDDSEDCRWWSAYDRAVVEFEYLSIVLHMEVFAFRFREEASSQPSAAATELGVGNGSHCRLCPRSALKR